MNYDADAILAVIRKAEAPISTRELIRQFNVPKGARVDFRRELKVIERRGQIERVAGQTWRLPLKKAAPASTGSGLTGTLSINRRGTGYVRLDEASREKLQGTGDVMVAELDLADGLDGDTVGVQVLRETPKGLRGRITEVFDRAHPTVLGQYQKTGKGRGEVLPRSMSIHRSIRVAEPAAKLGVANHDWVVVEIDKFTANPEPLIGRIVERIGGIHDKGIDVLLLLRDKGIVPEFPAAVERAAEKLDVDWRAELKLRRDLRKLVTATIDPVTAKDFDDALSIEPLGEKGWRLWVHIADVSHFVRPGDALDDEARERSTSVYPVDRVVPMLPEKLSNDLCSLKPKVDRLAMTAELEVARDGSVRAMDFYSSVICSNQRLAYEEAQAFFEEKEGAADVIEEEVRKPLLALRDCARAMRKARFARGALDLDIPELEIVFHEDGQISHMRLRERFEAHMLVEDCMLAANEAVARHLTEKKVPLLYRVHETADPERMERLFPVFQALDIPMRMSKKGLMRPGDLQDAIKSLEKRPGGHILRRLVLRALKRACYSEENLGHFGLASKCYCHFTSPIRRYPDVVVHRQLRSLERGEAFQWPADKNGREALKSLGKHTSDKEREAGSAERDSETIKAIEYMVDHVGEVFEGRISGVQPFGLFVELEPHGIDGLVSTRSMTDDRYDIDELGIQLVGRRSGRRLRLTDKVRVRVARANPFEMDLDLELVEGGGRVASGKPGARKGRKTPFYQSAPRGKPKRSGGKKRGR
ncbi:MAG: ribonuclease [Candidatus Sumerlaeota bacterium]|nr:ribonuclease [Candidatus Sumerlaeota bacterium]